MATPTETTRTLPPTTPKRVLAAIHNLPRRMRSGTLRTTTQPPVPPLPQAPHQAQVQPPQRTRARTPSQGKENTPPMPNALPPRRRRPAPLLPKSSKHIFGLGMMGLPSPRDLDAPSPPAFASRFPFSAASAHAAANTLTPTLTPAPGMPPAAVAEGEKWAARNGRIVIKVWVPTTDDIWKVRVPEGVGLAAFRAAVAAKLGFEAAFSAVVEGRLRTIGDEDAFARWVAGRVREGRNTLLTAHRLELL